MTCLCLAGKLGRAHYNFMPDGADDVTNARLAALRAQSAELARSAAALTSHLAASQESFKAAQLKLVQAAKDNEATAQRKLEEGRAQLAVARALFEEEKSVVARVAPAIISSNSATITLNVGGTIFTTSRCALEAAPSFFGALVSGRHAVRSDANGAIFIDRDPNNFRHVLTWLSDGRCSTLEALPPSTKAALEVEVRHTLSPIPRPLGPHARLVPCAHASRSPDLWVRTRAWCLAPACPLLTQRSVGIKMRRLRAGGFLRSRRHV